MADQIEEEIIMEDEEEEEAKTTKFKQFDIISGPVSSDHHYFYNKNFSSNNNEAATKKIVQEWRILEKNLPESIFVRVYENRIDLLRAVIVGSSGTPYHNGLFFFDIGFPSDYPFKPPQLHYHSHGVKLNPNLYENGYVCLSLLNTWIGKGDEQWVPSKSTILQVLVSIQGLVLNEEPYFNEPGFLRGEMFLRKEMRSKRSLAYNEEMFLLSCLTMLYVVSKPPVDFKEFVTDHFHDCSEAILKACRDYVNGGKFSFGNSGFSCSTAVEKVSSKRLKKSMKTMYPKLESAFSKEKSSLSSSSLGIGKNSSLENEIEQIVVKQGCGFGKLIESCLGFKKVTKVKEIEEGGKRVV